LIAYAFGVCQNGYIEDSKGQVAKTLIKELLFKHDIRSPYTNEDQWMSISVNYQLVLDILKLIP
jgi:hypothetical protein